MDSVALHIDPAEDDGAAEGVSDISQTEQMLALILNDLQAPVDRPEMWEAFPRFLDALPDLPFVAERALHNATLAPANIKAALEIVIAMCEAYTGKLELGIERLTRLATHRNQCTLAQGALFHVEGMADPANPKYNLNGKICTKPFEEFHVLEGSTHLCCASWLPESAGNLNFTDWESTWNSQSAQAIRASVHDGSFRYCNKTACRSHSGQQPASCKGRSPGRSERWKTIVAQKERPWSTVRQT